MVHFLQSAVNVVLIFFIASFIALSLYTFYDNDMNTLAIYETVLSLEPFSRPSEIDKSSLKGRIS